MTRAPCLAEDVFFCVAQGHGVFLDLKHDAYSAIAFPAGTVASDGAGEKDPADEAAFAALIAAHRVVLLEAGLITLEPRQGTPLATSLSIPRPAGHIYDLKDQRAFGFPGRRSIDVRASGTDWFDFLLAAQCASRGLRTQPIAAIVHAVRRRKSALGDRLDDLDGLRRETMIFSLMRPWHPRDYLCLFDAFALLEFLARRRLYPTWVFGVQAQPFGAHCWVQSGERLVNEGIEYANQFTPIMAV